MNGMNFRFLVVSLMSAFAAGTAQAHEGVDLALKSGAVAAAASAPGRAAPFVARVRDPMPELLLRDEQRRQAASGACEYSARDVCYDLADRRVVYRPARAYMPRLQGLTPESVSLRHDRLIFRYSFK